MRKVFVLALAVPCFAMVSACSGGDEAEGTDSAAEGEAAVDPAAQQAFNSLLECNSTTWAAYSLVGGETMFAEGAEKDALTELETALRARKDDLQLRMETDGAALGLSPEAITEQFNQHNAQFVHGPDNGTRVEYAREIAGQSDACYATLPGATG